MDLNMGCRKRWRIGTAIPWDFGGTINAHLLHTLPCQDNHINQKLSRRVLGLCFKGDCESSATPFPPSLSDLENMSPGRPGRTNNWKESLTLRVEEGWELSRFPDVWLSWGCWILSEGSTTGLWMAAEWCTYLRNTTAMSPGGLWPLLLCKTNFI